MTFEVGDKVRRSDRTFVVAGLNTISGNVYLDEYVGTGNTAGIVHTTESEAGMGSYERVVDGE